MYAALPRADYYEDSALWSRHHRAWRPAGVRGSGTRLRVPVFEGWTHGAV